MTMTSDDSAETVSHISTRAPAIPFPAKSSPNALAVRPIPRLPVYSRRFGGQPAYRAYKRRR